MVERYEVVFTDDGLIKEVPVSAASASQPRTQVVFTDDGRIIEVPITPAFTSQPKT